MRLVWVPEHHGTSGSDIAEAFAKQASEQTYLRPVLIVLSLYAMQ